MKASAAHEAMQDGSIRPSRRMLLIEPGLGRDARHVSDALLVEQTDAQSAEPAFRLEAITIDNMAAFSETLAEEMIDDACGRLGGLDAVVISLGLPDSHGPSLHELSLASWQDGLDRCLKVPFILARQAVSEFLGAGAGGRLVFVAAEPLPHHADFYPAAHTALLAMSRSISKEYGRVSIVSNVVTCRSLERPNRALAEAVCFLASHEASFVAGEVLCV